MKKFAGAGGGDKEKELLVRDARPHCRTVIFSISTYLVTSKVFDIISYEKCAIYCSSVASNMYSTRSVNPFNKLNKCTGESVFRTSFSLAEILELAGTTGGGSGMAPSTSTRISARLTCVQEHV